jgi:hypothetical protein
VWWPVPDGTSTDTDPGTPEEQINTTVATVSLFETISRTMAPVLGLLGADAPTPEIGGGGGAGAYMFASLDELDGVIQQWQDLVDEIKADQGNIESAVVQAAQPAGDDVSSDNFRESSDVVKEMQKHNEQLLVYAEHYVVKLKECRAQMATTEDGTQTSMNQVH